MQPAVWGKVLVKEDAGGQAGGGGDVYLCSEWMNEGSESSVKGRLSSGTHVLQTGPRHHTETEQATGTVRE